MTRPVDPAQSRTHAANGRIGALESWGRTVDRERRTRNAREAAFRRFEQMVPAEITDPAARERAADSLRRASMLRLAQAGAAARRANAAQPPSG